VTIQIEDDKPHTVTIVGSGEAKVTLQGDIDVSPETPL